MTVARDFMTLFLPRVKLNEHFTDIRLTPVSGKDGSPNESWEARLTLRKT